MQRVQLLSKHVKGGELGQVLDAEDFDLRQEVGIIGGRNNECAISLDQQRNKSYVPQGFLQMLRNTSSPEQESTTLSVLQFLMQKDVLAQDSFLIGPPGAYKRRLAMAYCELAGREVEYLAISQDSTVSDIKQRREIRAGTALFEDSAAVRAAIHGRVLILEGVEKAERNILSVINNLLENREMSLEDGRFLTNPKRFDEIGTTGNDRKDIQLVRVSDKFRVICLGVPVPEYEGNPLDPPFRSRFQCKDVVAPCARSELTLRMFSVKQALDNAAVAGLEGVSSIKLKRNSLPHEFDRFIIRLEQMFPSVNPRFAIGAVFPFPQLPSTDVAHRGLILETYKRYGFVKHTKDEDEIEFRDRMLGPKYESNFGYALQLRNNKDNLELEFTSPSSTVKCTLHGHTAAANAAASDFVQGVSYQSELLTEMLALYCVAEESQAINLFTLVGNRGVGKTCLLKQFARKLNVELIAFPLHRDMTAQDLFLRRGTRENGDTVWHASPLLQALERGSVLVLDGVESLLPSTLSTLSSLLTDRFAALPDGTRIVAEPAHKLLPTDRVCHKKFRIVCVGRPVSTDGRAWMTSEVMSCCIPFVWCRPLTIAEERIVIHRTSSLPQQLDKLFHFAEHVRTQKDDQDLATLSLSTRQLIRISRRITPATQEGELADLVRNACLWRFLPILTRTSLDAALERCGIHSFQHQPSVPPPIVQLLEQPEKKTHRIKIGTLRIGKQECDILQPRNEHEKSLIPDTYFVENPRQSRILGEMLTDYVLGSHLLLVGNQGTGKNKLVDRLLHLLRLPREYIQLDRDSTVGALTSQPIVENGVIRYEDSPLVRAARFGRILVIDEADKAPTHVTAVLKSLLSEDGEMLLADGRRLVSRNSSTAGDQVIPVHPDFRAIVLANRVGFPFLGNDFFRETGDVFAPFAVENPDEESEIALLREYAPQVPEETLRKLSKAFQDLRALVNEGKLLYPYSTRELVNMVRHMEAFPKDGIAATMQNVFDFDRYAVEDRKTISSLFERHGIPIGMQSRFKVRTGQVASLPEPVLTETWKPAAVAKQQHPTFVIHAIEWKDQVFPMQPTAAGQPSNLSRVEHRANTFDEQVFAFNLPTAELHSSGAGVVGAAMLKNSSLVVASNDTYNALRFYCVSSTFQTYTAVDMTVPHFNFRGEYIPAVRKPAPSRCLLFPLPGSTDTGLLGMYTHEDQSVFVLDLAQHTFRMFTLDLAVFRTGRENSAGRNLFVERTKTILVSNLCEDFGVLIAYQQDSHIVLFYDLLADVRTTVHIPFPLALLDVTSPFSFLLRSTGGGEQFALLAHTPNSSASTASTALILTGTARLTYTKFTLQRIDKYDMIGEKLHGAYSYVAAQALDASWQVKLEHEHTEHRFMRSPGTVCQIAEGFAQTFSPQHQQSLGRETLIKSVLRTHTTSKNVTILAASPVHLRGTSLLCSLYVNPKKKRKQGRQQSSGYLGFDPDAVLEVVDLKQRTLRHVTVALPETNKRRGSAVLHERFEPDLEDDEEEEEENAELGVLALDEANAPVLRQRAPFLFLFQSVQGDVLTLDRTGQGRMFQVDQTKLDQALENWKQVVGEYANNDDLDMDDGEEYDEDEDEEEEDYEDDDNDESGDFEMEEDEDEEQEQDQPNSGGGKAQKGGSRAKKSGKRKRSKSGGGKQRRGGQPRRPNGPPSRRSGSGEGEGKGQGSGQGKGGGQGSGAGGGSGQLPEPGQFRGPRPLSARDRVIAEERLAELRRLTRYFPNDRGLQEELEAMEQRIDEANEADRLGRGERGATMEDEETARLASLRKRLEKVEAEIAAALAGKRDVTRLRAEAAQLRELIDKLLSGDEGSGGKRGGLSSNRGAPAQLDEEARKQAKKMEKEAWKEVLEGLDANPQDSALYQRYKDSIASEVRELRATLEQMHAKKNERVWLNNKDVGDLDDRKLVDGLTGERNIYKRRGERPPDPFAFQEYPKRITFLFDVSSSMSRYSMDGRLERSLECATMAMEALKGFEHKFSWKIKGHSGGTDDITFVEPNKYPKDDAAKLEVLRRMNAHADSCGSGDNTLEATKLAIREITKEQGDEYFTILFSDANIEQYDIKPADLKALLDQDERVNVFIVFIGSMGAQAERLRAELPQDKVFVTLTTSQIPAVLKRIFLSSVLKE